MRIAIISDIHGNGVALGSVLNDLESEHIDRIISLGDIATDGPQPREVIAQLKTLNSSVVMGNMDAWILDPPPRKERIRPIEEIQYWGVSQLSPDDLDYLRTFRVTVEMSLDKTTDLLCYHGSPQTNERGIGSTTPDEDLEQMLAGHHATVLAGGHTHRQMLRRHGDMTILNPGTVGAPMPQNDREHHPNQERHPMWAEYSIVDSRDNILRIELRRVPIDVNLLV
ncbi:metallophosphoesterase family protein, partial [Candidatus Bathyarchaeota archaeon]|nr:metallophosphoesterase family protein [Candidatus Bathyarchaeota archaeon]